MKKSNSHYFAILIASVLFVSCGKQKPESVVFQFSNEIINNDIAKAKEYCLPSAKEEIDRLVEINAFEKNINKEPIELMEVVIKNPNFNDGDTAIVNYKTKYFKSFFTLILKDGQWMIAKSPELKEIIVQEFESSDFFDLFNKEKSVYWEKYKGMNFIIKSLAVIYSSYGIPYIKEKNMIYSNNFPVSYSRHELQYKVFNNKAILNKNIKKSHDAHSTEEVRFLLEGFTAEEKSKIENAEELSKSDAWGEGVDSYNVKNIIDVFGNFSGYDFQYKYDITFSNCKLVNIANK